MASTNSHRRDTVSIPSRSAANTFRLAQLPSELLTLVLTYLPLPCKLRSLSHLSRLFPPLTAAAFQCDHLDLSAACLLWLSTSPQQVALFAQLQSMTALRESATSIHRDRELASLASRVLHPSPDVTQPFCALRILSLDLPDFGGQQTDRSLHSVCTSFAASLPLLHTLAVAVKPMAGHPVGWATSEEASLSGWLVRLPSLRHLTLSVYLGHRALLTAFSLPLLSLDLRGCLLVLTSAVRHYSDAELDAVSGTLRRLSLPSDLRGNRPWDASVQLEQLLQRYGQHNRLPAGPPENASQPAWRLRHLRYAQYASSPLLQIATLLSSLTSLHISCFASRPVLHSFFAVASPSCLPQLTRLTVPVTDVLSRRTDEAAIDESCLAFFPSFAPQLQRLTLTALSSSARSCQTLFASVLTCTRLIALEIISDIAVGKPIALPARITPMRQLKHLHIRAPIHRTAWASHLGQAEVVRLLESCPLLHDLSLRMPNASINLLPAIVRCCPLLRLLAIRSDGVELWGMGEELAALAAQPPSGAFAFLHTLQIDHDLTAGQTSQQPTAAVLRALSAVLGRAPIRRLCVPHLDVTNIPFYSAFPHVVRLRLHNPQLRAVLQHYCHPPPAGSPASDDDRRLDSWLARATKRSRQADAEAEDGEDGEEERLFGQREAEEEWLRCPGFVGERVFAGMDGRPLTGREAWLERGTAVAAAETERRRLVALEKAKQQQKTAKKGGNMKHAAEMSAADAFFAASGVKRKR